jgi:hypothetical protein
LSSTVRCGKSANFWKTIAVWWRPNCSRSALFIFTRSADEFRDPERLFHQTEEQFDLPASFVEVGDLLGGSIEVICENAQPLAGFGLDDDFAHPIMHRILAVVALTGGQEPDPIAQNVRSLGQRHVFGLVQRRVGLEARHQPAAERVELGPKGEVVLRKSSSSSTCGPFHARGPTRNSTATPCPPLSLRMELRMSISPRSGDFAESSQAYRPASTPSGRTQAFTTTPTTR